MAEIDDQNHKLLSAKQAYEQATALRLELDRSFAETKNKILNFFKTSPLLAQFKPEEQWLGHAGTEAYQAALSQARNAITKLNNVNTGNLADSIDRLLNEPLPNPPSKEEKRIIKSEAHAFLDQHGATSWMRSAFRGEHTPADELVSRLQALQLENPGNTVMSSTIDRHIQALQPFTQSTILKQRIVDLFNSDEYKECFGDNGAKGIRRYFRFDHTPMAELKAALKASLSNLNSLLPGPGQEKALREIEGFNQILQTRLEIKRQLAASEARAAEMDRSFKDNESNIKSFTEDLKMRVEKRKQLMTRKSTELSAAWHDLGGLEAQLNARMFESEEAESVTPEHKDKIAVLQASIAKKHNLITQLDEEIIQADNDLLQLTQVLDFCSSNLSQIKSAQSQLDELRRNYEKNKALVVYFKLGDDVGAELRKVASALRAGQSPLHAIASIQVIFIFEAGVRLGYDLGFVGLQAKVGMTMVLAGSMNILENREIMFSFRFALYFCIAGKAQVGTPEEVSQALESVARKAPEKLISASASAKCSLVDVQDCLIYPNEDVWVAQWSHQIVRRIVFLNCYSPDTPASDFKPEWLDSQLTKLEEGTANIPGLSEETQDRIKTAIKKDNDRIHLLNTPHKGVTFNRPALQVNASSNVAVFDEDKLTLGGTTHASYQCMHRSIKGNEMSTQPFGKLEESACTFTGDNDAIGEAVYHTFTPVSQGSSPHRFLEVIQKTSNSAKYEILKADWISSMPNRPVTPDKLLQLSLAVNFMPPSSYAENAPNVYLPQNTCETISIKSRADLSLEIAERLARLQSGDEASKALTAMLELPEKIESAAKDASSSIEMASETLNAELDTLQSLSTFAQNQAGEAKAQAENIKLKKSNAGYVRYVNQTRVSCIPAHGGIETYETWTPQVYRAFSQQAFSINIPIPEVPLLPGISVYFNSNIQCKREVSQYELLGTDTFSYLKMMYQCTRDNQIQLDGKDVRFFDTYLNLHWPEIENILRNVTVMGSGAYSELCMDYFHRKTTSVKLAAAARQLGDACYQNFAPMDRNNPFMDTARQQTISQLKQVLLLQQSQDQSLQNSLYANSLRATAERIKAGPGHFSKDCHTDWNTLSDNYAATHQARESQIKKYRDIFNKSVTHPVVVSDQAIFSPVLEQTKGDLDNLLQTLDDDIKKLGHLNDGCLFVRRVNYALKLHAMILSAIDAPQLPHIDLSWSLAINPYSSTLPQRPPAIEPRPGPRPPIQRSDARKEKEASQMWREQVSCPMTYFASSLFTDAVQYGPGGRTLLESEVPREWAYKRGTSFLQITSSETTKLIDDNNRYHLGIEQAKTQYHQGVSKGRLEKTPDEHLSNLQYHLHHYLIARLNLVDELLRAINEWKIGKPGKQREEDSSKRMPNVVMLLEVPALADKLTLLRLQMSFSLRQYIHDLLNSLKGLDAIAIHAAPQPMPESTVLELRDALLQYFEHSEDQGTYHALLHGMKQITLPNEETISHDVSTSS